MTIANDSVPSSSSARWPIYLGCPVWMSDHWEGQVYPPRTPRNQWLSWYSRIFNAVEGNSTFYALPKLDVVKRWASEAADGFHFCFKFPKVISHECLLVGADDETRAFLEMLEILAEADRLGPTFLQLGPNFGPDRFKALQEYLGRLPKHLTWAVELRHLDWFDSGDNEARVNELLHHLGIDKVLFDSRPLYQSSPDDQIEAKSQQRKPRTPVRQTVTGKRPILRLVGRNRVELVDRFLDQWTPIITKWVVDGLAPYVFTHAPDDAKAPELARRLMVRLRESLQDKSCVIDSPPMPARQLSLLGDEEV